MRGIMVAIEGLDVVGKSTIALALSKKENWQYYRTPPPAYYEDCVRLGIDGFPVYTEERFWLFIRCLEYSSKEILRLLDAGISVAVDRWLWTTLSYHFVFNAKLEAKWQEVANKEISALICPNLSMLIHIFDKKVYEQRKADRKNLTAHDKMVVNNEKVSSAIFNNFKRLNPNFVHVDNSGNFESTMDVVWRQVVAVKATN